ncbi:MAG: hypothetical protein ACO1QR_08750 [Chthoniobacteraceae bacterium]
MKKVIPLVLAVVVIALASALAYQSQRGRAALNAANADLAKERSRIAELEADLARLRSAQASYQAESQALRERLAVKATDGGDASPIAEVAGTPAVKAEKKPDANPMSQFAKMFKDPAMKKVMRTQQSMGIRMMYGDLSAELGLSPDDADALNELLTDRQLAMSEQGMEMMSGGADEKKMKEFAEATKKNREEYDKELANMLGEDGLKKFQEYERSMADRVMLRQYQDQFASRGTPLQEEQRKQLLGIMTEERTKAPASPFDPASGDVAEQMKAMRSEEIMEQQFEQQRQINSRVLTRAAQILSPEQVNSLRTSQDQMLEMQKMGLMMSRQMFNRESSEEVK